MLRLFWTVVLGLLAVTMITPFIWMLSASMKMPLDVMKLPIEWIPKYFPGWESSSSPDRTETVHSAR